MSNISTKQKINEVQHQQKHGTSDAATRKRVGMFKLLQYMCSKDMREPLVPMFSSTRHPTLVAVNFSIPTSLGRSCVVF